MADTLFAFKCKNCGVVEPAGAAGENAVPGACHVCRHGVKYSMNEDGSGFTVTQEPENWIILAELSAEELQKIGLTSDQVEKHSAKGSPPQGVRIEAMTSEQVGSTDKA